MASSKWSSVGSATIEFDPMSRKFTRVVAGAISWPALPLTARALADAIDTFARREGICAVALDGPQGWRDPATPVGTRGVGRRCEYLCRTQGKTGAYPRTYPAPQRGWIEFSVAVFDALLAKPGVVLARPEVTPPVDAGYVVLECFPTSAWRSSGLRALPGKSRKPDLKPYLRDLTAVYELPATSVTSHDDLQAIVAALIAAAVAGGPAIPMPRGAPEGLVTCPDGKPLRIEGYIWDARPRSRPGTPRST